MPRLGFAYPYGTAAIITDEDSDEAQNSNVHVSTPVTNSSDKIVDRTKSMAKDKNQTQMDGECLFSPTCGRNICIDGSTASWINNDSGGRFFIDKSLSPDEEIFLTFSGKGHAEVGIISIDPITITDVIHVGNIKELTVIQTARIYKQEGTTKIKRSKEGDRIITEAEGKKSRSKVDKEQSIWITVNILFGDLKVKIGSKGFKFSPNKGENISTKDECANLSKPYPCAVCYVLNPIQRGKTLAFQVEDINKGGTSSKNCSFKLAISKSNPEEFMSSADKYCDITSLPVIHFEKIPTKYNKEISVELTTDGTVKIKHEKGRIQLRCARKERQNNENTVPPISRIIDTHTNQSDVPDSVYTNHQNVKSQPEKYKSLIHERIPEDFQMFVSMLGIKPVLDYLYQDGNITMEDFQRLRQLSKWDTAEANRELLFTISRRQNLDTEFLEDISTKSKQDGILAKMFPHQSN
ncbi:unnamed protein product [Mytilus edulis]|uniref:Uncharacterized protein n=1 Tax=Mytilus edulis TaxID=6550 RepID=A0A8S3QQX2_MYTED|nr:unnamed protein product [Mytilus edulis]